MHIKVQWELYIIPCQFQFRLRKGKACAMVLAAMVVASAAAAAAAADAATVDLPSADASSSAHCIRT